MVFETDGRKVMGVLSSEANDQFGEGGSTSPPGTTGSSAADLKPGDHSFVLIVNFRSLGPGRYPPPWKASYPPPGS